jgi:hypothetical protein
MVPLLDLLDERAGSRADGAGCAVAVLVAPFDDLSAQSERPETLGEPLAALAGAIVANQQDAALAVLVAVALHAVLVQNRLHVPGEVDDIRHTLDSLHMDGVGRGGLDGGTSGQRRGSRAGLVAAETTGFLARENTDEALHPLHREVVFVQSHEEERAIGGQ